MNLFSGGHRNGRHFRAPALFVMFAGFALMALSPIAASAFRSDQVGPNHDLAMQETQVADDSGAEPKVPPPTETPAPTTDASIEATDDAAQPDGVTTQSEGAEPTATLSEAGDAAPPTHRLTINVYRCDHPTFDPSFSSNFQLVVNECIGPGSGTFSVDSSIPVAPQTGSALEFQIGVGLYIRGEVQPGFDDPIVNCFVLDANGNTLDQIGPAEASGGDWKVPNDDHDVHCDWYQVDQGLGVVYIVNMACPGPLGFPKPDLNQMITTCTSPAGPIEFGVQHGQIYSDTVTSSGEFNDAYFDAVSTGPIAIWAEPPPAVESARMFCQVNTIDGVEIAPFAEVPIADFRATSLTLAHDQRLHCSWFNIPEGPGVFDPGPPPTATLRPGVADIPEDGGVLDPGTGPTATKLPGVADIPEDGGVLDPGEVPAPTATPPGSASEFRVRLHTCPAGYDPLAVGVDPNIDCLPGPNGVTFTLTDQDPDTADVQSMTGDSIDNAVTFGGLAQGDYTITQMVQDGIDSMFVLGCAGGGIDPIPTVIDGSLPISLPAGIIQTCPWFNVPVAGSGAQIAREGTPAVAAAITGTSSLTMYAYDCPAGFDVSAVDSNPQASCTLTNGVEFDMDNADDDSGGRIFETGSTGTGYSTIDNLPADTYTIDEMVRNGTTATVVWDCYDFTGSSTRTDPLVTGDKLTYELEEGAQVRCDWFNVTGGTGRVIVNKHACAILVPAYTLDLGQLNAQCNDDPGTIEFTVVSGAHRETQPASKTPLVLASFANIPSGYVAVVEDLPDGWSTPIVHCQVSLEDATVVSPPAPMDVIQDRQISFLLEPGHVVFCDWFNVTGGFVDVHITKHVCPPGFDAYSADTTALGLNCQAGDPGSVDFMVQDGALYLETRTATNVDQAVFEDVPSGSLRVTEVLPEAYGLPVVYCRVEFEDGTIVLPSSRAPVVGGEGPSIDWNLSAGQILYCDWVNVPGGLGMVSVWKQACPAGFDAYNATLRELELACGEDIDTIDFSLTSGSFSDTASSTNLFRYADFPAVPTGEVTVTETPPHGFGTPVVYCHVQEPGKPLTPSEKMDVSLDTSITWHLEPNQWLICRWFNVLETDSTVTVIKWICPEGTTYDKDYDWYAANCTQAHEGVEFSLTHTMGVVPGVTNASGQISWADIPLGPFSIQEYIPRDYDEPVVFCSAGSGVTLAQLRRMEVSGGYLESELTMARTLYTCHWFNIYGGPGHILIHKYTCPPGYDLHASDSNPAADCTEKTNGVTFSLADSDPATGDAQQETGQSVDGAASFGELEPGAYTVAESVPQGTRLVFVLDCTGGKMGAVRSYPLSTGDSITIDVGAGETIECRWYNVPDFDDGRLTVIKYDCSTATYESDIDCERFEGGQGFDLVAWDGDSWEYQASGTTDGGGQLSWTDLAEGQYWLDETGRDWCHIASDALSEDGNWLDVNNGEDTIVAVYNCGAREAGTPGETPTKYPNTGVGPAGAGSGGPLALPGFATLAGALLFLRGLRSIAPISQEQQDGPPTNDMMTRPWTRRQLAAGIGLPLAGSVLLSRAIFARGDQSSAPDGGTPAPETPASLCLPATPSPSGDDTCQRGPVPATLQIESIGVDAPVEVLETVGGVMQQPSDEGHVAWYKETARLGETGNILIAGHLNWWGVPEAVFFNLGTLRTGDEVVILAADDTRFTYEVEWVRNESNLVPPDDDVLGMTDHEAVTLITCGGEWDTAISEYNARTVARAVRAGRASAYPEAT